MFISPKIGFCLRRQISLNAKLLSSVSDAVVHVLTQFGIQDFKKGRMAVYDKPIHAEYVTILVGLTHGVRGNIAYSMCHDIASRMMMGMPVEQLDEMAQSAITEMANMITGYAATLYATDDKLIDISPPNLMLSDSMTICFNAQKTVLVEMLTEIGSVNLFIGLEERAG
jgi:chemotaxis protein CheX